MLLKVVKSMLTKKELALHLKVTTMTIDRHMKNGLPYIKFPNGTVRFDLEKVMEWLIPKE